MGGIFKSPSAPAPAAPPPPPPAIEDAAAGQQAASDEARRRRGRAATILTGPEGVNTSPVGMKTLLGS